MHLVFSTLRSCYRWFFGVKDVHPEWYCTYLRHERIAHEYASANGITRCSDGKYRHWLNWYSYAECTMDELMWVEHVVIAWQWIAWYVSPMVLFPLVAYVSLFVQDLWKFYHTDAPSGLYGLQTFTKDLRFESQRYRRKIKEMEDRCRHRGGLLLAERAFLNLLKINKEEARFEWMMGHYIRLQKDPEYRKLYADLKYHKEHIVLPIMAMKRRKLLELRQRNIEGAKRDGFGSDMKAINTWYCWKRMNSFKPLTLRQAIRFMQYGYTVPMNISLWHNTGFLLALFTVSQLITGLLLASHYNPSCLLGFQSVMEFILEDTPLGLPLRYLHANGASLLAALLYAHMARNMLLNSRYSSAVWSSGISLYLLSICTSFTGYSLVIGQMSLWATIVILKLVASIPLIGVPLLHVLLGGPTINDATIGRFFTLHYLLPLWMLCLILVHVYCLHRVNSSPDFPHTVPRSSRFSLLITSLTRDLLLACILYVFLIPVLHVIPSCLLDAENYFQANPLLTPAHIKPEWYLSWLYGLLRAIPNKLLGISLIVTYLYSLCSPLLGSHRSYPSIYSWHSRTLLWIVFLEWVILGYACLLVNISDLYYVLVVSSVLGLCVLPVLSQSSINA